MQSATNNTGWSVFDSALTDNTHLTIGTNSKIWYGFADRRSVILSSLSRFFIGRGEGDSHAIGNQQYPVVGLRHRHPEQPVPIFHRESRRRLPYNRPRTMPGARSKGAGSGIMIFIQLTSRIHTRIILFCERFYNLFVPCL